MKALSSGRYRKHTKIISTEKPYVVTYLSTFTCFEFASIAIPNFLALPKPTQMERIVFHVRSRLLISVKIWKQWLLHIFSNSACSSILYHHIIYRCYWVSKSIYLSEIVRGKYVHHCCTCSMPVLREILTCRLLMWNDRLIDSKALDPICVTLGSWAVWSDASLLPTVRIARTFLINAHSILLVLENRYLTSC